MDSSIIKIESKIEKLKKKYFDKVREKKDSVEEVRMAIVIFRSMEGRERAFKAF